MDYAKLNGMINFRIGYDAKVYHWLALDYLKGVFMDRQNDDRIRKHDEELFQSLDKNRKWRKKKALFTVVSCVLIVALVVGIAVTSLKESVWNKFGAGAGEVLQCQASVGTIRKTVSGSGVLTDVDLEIIAVPEGVEVLEVLVKANDTVVEGQALAAVDMQSIHHAISSIQQQITNLDTKIRNAEDDSVNKNILSGVSGRVKAIYAMSGDNVEQIMYENGALAVLSLDGYMAADIAAEGLASAETVSVRWSGGSMLGTVEQISGDISTILFSDLGPAPDETITVCNLQGDILGSGVAYIHSPLRITGYVGSIENVHVKIDDAVKVNTKLFTLTDTDSRVNYDTLLRQRTELEEEFMELLRIQRHGAVVSPVSGRVFSTDETTISGEIAVISLDKQMSVTIGVDEADILSLQIGQRVEVTVNSVGEESYMGVLTDIDRTMNDGSYSAEVTFNKSEGMLSGMTADVRIEIMSAENVVMVPVKAVNLTQTGAYVYTGYDPDTGKYENRVDVIIGLEGEGYVEIKEGLNVGDTVYYTDAATVKDLFDSMDNHRPTETKDEAAGK